MDLEWWFYFHHISFNLTVSPLWAILIMRLWLILKKSLTYFSDIYAVVKDWKQKQQKCILYWYNVWLYIKVSKSLIRTWWDLLFSSTNNKLTCLLKLGYFFSIFISRITDADTIFFSTLWIPIILPGHFLSLKLTFLAKPFSNSSSMMVCRI